MTDHTASPGPPVDTDRLLVSTWLVDDDGGTGVFLGYATLATTTFVVLHPRAAQAALAAPRPPNRLRVAVDTPAARYVVDGQVTLGSAQVPGSLVAVEVDFPIAEEPTPIPLPEAGQNPGRFWALDEFLQAAGSNDPAQAPERPVGTGYERRERHRLPGTQPPWCYVWPGAWGCRRR